MSKRHRGSVTTDTGVVSPATPNNISLNKNIKEKKYNFSFLTSLIEIGVSDEVAKAWLQVRKTKRATNTEIAFNRIKSEIDKSGYTPDECIRTAVEKSWQGFQADWMPRRPQRYETMEEIIKRLENQ